MNNRNKLSHFASVVLYVISIALYLTSALSIVSGTGETIFTYNYPLRVAADCLAIACAAVAPFCGKSNKWLKVIKILLSVFIIGFILVFGFRNNVIA